MALQVNNAHQPYTPSESEEIFNMIFRRNQQPYDVTGRQYKYDNRGHSLLPYAHDDMAPTTDQIINICYDMNDSLCTAFLRAILGTEFRLTNANEVVRIQINTYTPGQFLTTAEEAPVTTLSTSSKTMVVGVERVGLGVKWNNEAILTPFGLDEFRQQMAMVQKSRNATKTARLLLYLTRYGLRRDLGMLTPIKDFGINVGIPDALKKEAGMFNIFKQKNAFMRIYNWICSLVKKRDGVGSRALEPNVFVVPEGTDVFMHEQEIYRDILNNIYRGVKGVSEQDNLEDSQFKAQSTIKGVKLFEVPPVISSSGQGLENHLAHVAEIGEFYVLTADNTYLSTISKTNEMIGITSSTQLMYVFDGVTSTYKPVTILDGIRYSGLFPMKEGLLHPGEDINTFMTNEIVKKSKKQGYRALIEAELKAHWDDAATERNGNSPEGDVKHLGLAYNKLIGTYLHLYGVDELYNKIYLRDNPPLLRYAKRLCAAFGKIEFKDDEKIEPGQKDPTKMFDVLTPATSLYKLFCFAFAVCESYALTGNPVLDANPFDLMNFFRAMFQCDIVIPFNLLVLRPRMTYDSYGLIALRGGGETISMYSGFEHSEQGRNAVIATGNLSFWERFAIAMTDPDRHSVLANTLVDRVHGGVSTEFFDANDDVDLSFFTLHHSIDETTKSMIAVLLPMDERPAECGVMSIMGTWSSELKSMVNVSEYSSYGTMNVPDMKNLHYSTATETRKKWGFTHASRAANEHFQSLTSCLGNDICFAGHAFYPNKADKVTGKVDQYGYSSIATGHWAYCDPQDSMEIRVGNGAADSTRQRTAYKPPPPVFNYMS